MFLPPTSLDKPDVVQPYEADLFSLGALGSPFCDFDYSVHSHESMIFWL